MLNDILLLALNAVSKYLNLIEIWIKKFYLDLSQVSIVVPILFMALSLVILFLPPTILSKIIFLPFKIITIFLRHIGVIHDNRTWGVVYDSVTKEPVDPAYITIRGGLGQVFSTAITDLDGRFALILPPGIYTLGVEKTNYIFPSQKLLDKKTDGYFTGLYFGDKFEVIGGERAVAFAIPIDPADSQEFKANNNRWRLESKRKKTTPYSSAYPQGISQCCLRILCSGRPFYYSTLPYSQRTNVTRTTSTLCSGTRNYIYLFIYEERKLLS